jgi:RNA 2',3'-cyclic 3'-phosphodiesterase
MSMKLIRSFIAVDYPPGVKQAILQIIEQGKQKIKPGLVRWVAETNLHLTLKFLGELDAKRLDQVIENLHQLADEVSPFEYTVSGRGMFPNSTHPRILWVGAETCPPLTRLAGSVDLAAHKTGLPLEDRPFTPHLTIARVNRDLPNLDLKTIGDSFQHISADHLGLVQVDHITLYQSQLFPDGAKYTPLSVIHLAKTES